MDAILKRIENQKIRLILDYIFWGIAASRLLLVEDRGCKTCYTDARVIGYNPKFIAQLSDLELLFALAHEVLHVVFGHCFRGMGKDHELWNDACDYANNLVLVAAGFILPAGCLYDLQYEGMSAEEIYFKLLKEQQGNQKAGRTPKSQSKGGANAPGQQSQQASNGEQVATPTPSGNGSQDGTQSPKRPFGEVRQNADPQLEKEWKTNTMLAAQQAAERGQLSGSIKRLVQEVCAPDVDFVALTYLFVQKIQPSDYTWSQPNRNYLYQGFYVPSLSEKRLGKLYWGNDTSGSVRDFQQHCCQAMLRSLMADLRPESLTVLHCDSAIKKIEEFYENDPILIHPYGGGGTDFRPVFDKLNALDESPAGLIYLTDMEGEFPSEAPDYPVLWISTKRNKKAPFGETIYLDLRGK